MAVRNFSDGPVNDLLWSDQSDWGVSLTACNLPGTWVDGSTDPMYNTYMYGQSGTLTFNNLPAGTYALYAYSFDGNFSLSVGSSGYGTQTTAYNYPVVNPPPWKGVSHNY
ncbi:MAG: hypothetical protein ACLQVX_25055 [Limisphaerales bacterium]